MSQHKEHPPEHAEHKGHHILPVLTGAKVWIALLIFTAITVAAARFDMGNVNFTVAMAIATIKAFLVVLFFMGMKYDTNENRIIFFSSFIFLFIFIFLTYSDVLFRELVMK